jgi:hypothetical protein
MSGSSFLAPHPFCDILVSTAGGSVLKTSCILLYLAISLTATVARSQSPVVQVYLDSQFQVLYRPCPPVTTIDTLYVVASGFTSPITDIEYSVNLYGNFVFFQDLIPAGFSGTGYSGVGMRVDFGGPINVVGKVLVQRIFGAWSCQPCGGGFIPFIVVEPHNVSGKIQATRWPDLAKIEADGGINPLCGVLPVASSTWGSIKALYR